MITAIAKKRYRWLGRLGCPSREFKAGQQSNRQLCVAFDLSPHLAYLLLSLRSKAGLSSDGQWLTNPPCTTDLATHAVSTTRQVVLSVKMWAGTIWWRSTSRAPHSHSYRGSSRSPDISFQQVPHPSLRNHKPLQAPSLIPLPLPSTSLTTRGVGRLERAISWLACVGRWE